MHLLSDSCNLINLNSRIGSKKVIVRNSKLSVQCLKKAYELGFISGFTVVNEKKIKVFLKYRNLEPSLRNICTISVPSRSAFLKKKKIQNSAKNNANGFLIMSTDVGIISDIECVYFSKGGKILVDIN